VRPLTGRGLASQTESGENPQRRQTVTKLLLGAVLGLLVLLHPAAAQAPPPELGQGWIPEFTLTSRQLLQLAEATPAEKFTWRPGPGVRSISEVYMHLAAGNFWLMEQAGVPSSPEASKMPKDLKSVTSKAEVIQWLRSSLDAVRKGYESADRQKKVQFFGKETTSELVFLRILIHNNEHMGQSIAYARMNGVVPPWSQVP
jgi:uncharacterized damage-inducible protein DinB